MELLNWRTLAYIFVGAILAGLAVGIYQTYENNKRETIASQLYKVQYALSQGRVEEAQKLVREINEPSSRAYAEILIGDYLYGKEKLKEASQWFDKASNDLTSSGVDPALDYLTKEKEAYILYLEGEYKKSLRILETIPKDAPNRWNVELLKAQNLLKLGQKEKAKVLLEDIAKSCPIGDIVLAAKYLLMQKN